MKINYTSQNIRTLRQHFNLTQDELSIKIGSKRHNVASWESGRAQPSVEMLQIISEIFNINVTDLVSNDLAEVLKDVTLNEDRQDYQVKTKEKEGTDIVEYLMTELKEKNKVIEKLLDIIKDSESK